MTERAIVLFDGFCNLCNFTVEFLQRRDSLHRLQFTTLQSPEGLALLAYLKIDPGNVDSVVLVNSQKAYFRSEAALRAIRYLPKPWSLLYRFIWLPRPFRDLLYDLVARYRYRWFGGKPQCQIGNTGGQISDRVRHFHEEES